jgi:predicted ATPase
MRSDLPTGTVTFLFTDVEGSTKLLHELGGEAYADALADHRRLIRAACSAEGGVEVDTQGDAFFFAFPTAPGALSAASSFTDALAPGPIRVRVGLHTGRPLLAHEGYVGDDVHFAARVASAGHGGQVVCSRPTAELVEAELTDLGEHRLKDIAQPVSLYQLGEGRFPPLKTISNTNLPRPASSFLGREVEVAEVVARIEQGARLLTLTGPGGTGKTRLAIEAASTLVPDYRAGVFWIGLASLRDPALVTESIAQTLGSKDGLAAHIADRELLLVLDNFEQVIEAAPELSQLLQGCPNLTLVVTSRELLRVQGEIEYAVPPLARSEAVRLFCTRSGLEASDDIVELCTRLDFLPLAVELAAARTKALTPTQILERLSGRLDLLKGGRDADPRQQTLRATIEWSYELLGPDERQLFARLSVFAGGCTLEAAEDVCHAELDTLQSLVEKSLVRFTNGRYWMLETIREYATDTPGSREDSNRTQRALIEHLLHCARPVTESVGQPVAPDLVERLEAERDNLRAALGWLSAQSSWDEACVLAIAYALLCRHRGPVSEGRLWLETVLAKAPMITRTLRLLALRHAASLAEIQRDHVASIERAEIALQLARDANDLGAVASTLLALGVAEGASGDFERAEHLERQALNMFAAAGNERHVRQTLGLLAWVQIAQRKYGEAEQSCERALELALDADDDRGVVLALGNLGHALARQGKIDEASVRLCEALRVTRQLMDLSGLADTFLEMASIAIARASYEKAAVLLGASSVLRETTEEALDLVAERQLLEAEDVLAAEVAPSALSTATARGREMTLDEAVDFALASID